MTETLRCVDEINKICRGHVYHFYFDVIQQNELYKKESSYVMNSLYTMALIFVEDPIVL